MSVEKTSMWVNQSTIKPKEKCVLCATSLKSGALVIQLECGCKVHNSCFNAYCERNTKDVINGVLPCPKCGSRLINSANYCMSAWAYEKGALDKETTDALKTFTPSTGRGRSKAKGKTKKRTGKRQRRNRRRRTHRRTHRRTRRR